MSSQQCASAGGTAGLQGGVGGVSGGQPTSRQGKYALGGKEGSGEAGDASGSASGSGSSSGSGSASASGSTSGSGKAGASGNGGSSKSGGSSGSASSGANWHHITLLMHAQGSCSAYRWDDCKSMCQHPVFLSILRMCLSLSLLRCLRLSVGMCRFWQRQLWRGGLCRRRHPHSRQWYAFTAVTYPCSMRCADLHKSHVFHLFLLMAIACHEGA